ncbi:TPA: prepilin-type N-terminal cleavage/methylation domain-containing protein [Klebsiella quasipneumoniae]|nr:prepilin-type N-terminal cleavage/methylation domain-containing protein [Klebsiella quasipneumoniae]
MRKGFNKGFSLIELLLVLAATTPVATAQMTSMMFPTTTYLLMLV